MRFCPFCAAENPADVTRCVQCSKQLPPARKRASQPPADTAAPARRVPKPAPPAKPTVIAKPKPAPAPVVAAVPAPVVAPPAPAVAVPVATAPAVAAAAPVVVAPAPAPVVAPVVATAPSVEQKPVTLPGPAVAPLPTPPPRARTSSSSTLHGLGADPVDVIATPIASKSSPEPVAPVELSERPVTLPNRPESVVAAEMVVSGSGTVRARSKPASTSTEVLPTPDDALLQQLPPMPPGPAAKTIIASVRYLVPLAKAIWARRRATRSIRSLLYDDQYLIDEVLRDIGRVAHESGLETGAVADSLQRVRHEEARQAKAAADLATADRNNNEEAARWKQEDGVHEQELARIHHALSEDEVELRRCNEEHRSFAAEAARHAAAAARLAKAKQTQLPASVTTAAEQKLDEDRKRALEQAAALDPQIAALTRKIVEWRAALAQAERDHAAVRAAHERIVETISRERARADREANEAAREISQLFVGIGTVLNLQRVPHDQFRELYERIDALRRTVHAREETIVRLDSELRAFDRDAAQTGLVTVGLSLGILSLIGIILAVLLAR